MSMAVPPADPSTAVAPSPGRLRWVTFALLAVLVASYAAWIVWDVRTNQPLDFEVYYLSGAAYARGEDPYAMTRQQWDALAARLRITHYAWPYRYPPYVAALFRDVEPIGHEAAMAGWLALNATAMVGAAWITARALGGGRLVPVAFGLLLLMTPALDTLMVGQVNGLLLLSLAVALWALMRERDVLLGASVAVGAALKVTPLALLAWLAWRRRRRAVLAGGGALALLTLAALPFVGAHAFVAYSHHALELARPELVFNGPTNVTFVGAIGRLLPDHLVAARTVGRILAGAVVAASIVVCWPRGDARRLMPVEFGLIVAAVLLVPPFTWFHQTVTLLVPLLVLAWWSRPAGARLPTTALLGAILILLALADAAWFVWAVLGLHHVFAPAWFYRFSFMTLLTMLVWGTCAGILWREKWGARASARAPHDERGGERGGERVDRLAAQER